ncbi:MAG: dihydroxyacetone kinase phosphoryl donor subunit DhaM [Naasia sp.]
MTVGLVFVSHSSKIAEGVVELSSQMAADVTLIAAGGTDDGRIGTSFELVQNGIAAADSGDGVVVLCDLGSAVLTAETALDFLDDDVRARVLIADAPLVEGAVAAAVAAQSGAHRGGVAAAAETAAGSAGSTTGSTTDSAAGDGVSRTPSEPSDDDLVVETIDLINREGLHARPAAEFVKLASKYEASVTVNGVDAKSLLRIMSLGLTRGDTLTLRGSGREAHDAVRALRDLVATGFGEE